MPTDAMSKFPPPRTMTAPLNNPAVRGRGGFARGGYPSHYHGYGGGYYPGYGGYPTDHPNADYDQSIDHQPPQPAKEKKEPVPHDALALAMASTFEDARHEQFFTRLAMWNCGTWRDAVISSPEMWADDGLLGRRFWRVDRSISGSLVELPELLTLSLEHDPGRWVRLEADLREESDHDALLTMVMSLHATHVDWTRVSANPYGRPYHHGYGYGHRQGHHGDLQDPSPTDRGEADPEFTHLLSLRVRPDDVQRFRSCTKLQELRVFRAERGNTPMECLTTAQLTPFRQLSRLDLIQVAIESLDFIESLNSLRFLNLEFVSFGYQPRSVPDAGSLLKLPLTLEEINCSSPQLRFPLPHPDSLECRFLRNVVLEVSNVDVIEMWVPLWPRVTSLVLTSAEGRHYLHGYSMMGTSSMSGGIAPATIQSMLTLKQLHHLTIRGRICERSFEAVAQHPSVEDVTIEGTPAGSQQVELFKRSQSIKSLQLSAEESAGWRFALAVAELMKTMDVRISNNEALRLLKLHGLLVIEEPSEMRGADLAHLSAAEPGLIKALELRGKFTDDCMTHLLPHLPHLTSFDVRDTHLTDAALDLIGDASAMKTFIASPSMTDAGLRTVSNKMPNLTYITVRGVGITDAGVMSLGKLRHLRLVELERTTVSKSASLFLPHTCSVCGIPKWDPHALDLSQSEVTDADLSFLEGPSGERMRINLSSTATTAAGHRFLAHTKGLKRLNLSHTGASFASLLAVAQVKTITSLELRGTKVDDMGLLCLSQALGNMKELNLAETLITNAGTAHLRNFPHLTVLDMSSMHRITDASLVHVAELKKLERLLLCGTNVNGCQMGLIATLPKLATLNMCNAQYFGDAGVAMLVAAPALRDLNLSRTAITNEALGCCVKMPSIEVLNVAGTRINDGGLAALKAAPSSLIELNLSNTKVQGRGLANLSSPSLQTVNLSRTQIGSSGILEMQKTRNCHSLQFLDVRNTNITQADVGLIGEIATRYSLPKGCQYPKKPRSHRPVHHYVEVDYQGYDDDHSVDSYDDGDYY